MLSEKTREISHSPNTYVQEAAAEVWLCYSILQIMEWWNGIKEREELLQLLIKMDKQRCKENFNEEESEKRNIKILWDGMKPSKGLKETIDSLRDKYSRACPNRQQEKMVQLAQIHVNEL